MTMVRTSKLTTEHCARTAEEPRKKREGMVKSGVLRMRGAFNTKLLEFLACPLSKEPLRYCEKSQELVNDALGVAYPTIDGIPCLVPMRGRILRNKSDKPQHEPS